MKKARTLLALVAAVAVLSACSSAAEEENTAAETTSATCSPDSLATVEAGTLTIATGEPAYYPWVIDDAPESGEGFEAAVAYAVAEELGYNADQVKWVRTNFDSAITPGPKNFDFNLQQFSITEDRAKVVDFSSQYYKSNQAIVTFKGSPLDGVTSLAELKAKAPKLGAAVSTISLDVIENNLGLKASVFNDNAAGVAALKNKQIDGFVADLPTALYLAGFEVENGLVVGQIDGSSAGDKGFGLLLSKGNTITTCVSRAVDAIRDNGTLQAITDKWLGDWASDAPVLK